MDFQGILTTLGIISTLILSGIALYKAFKTAPKEIQSADVDLSVKYDALLDNALARSKEYEDKLRDMEIVHSREVKELQNIVNEHEEEIKDLKEKIKHQEEEIRSLKEKVFTQDGNIIALKEVIAKDNKIEKT